MFMLELMDRGQAQVSDPSELQVFMTAAWVLGTAPDSFRNSKYTSLLSRLSILICQFINALFESSLKCHESTNVCLDQVYREKGRRFFFPQHTDNP